MKEQTLKQLTIGFWIHHNQYFNNKIINPFNVLRVHNFGNLSKPWPLFSIYKKNITANLLLNNQLVSCSSNKNNESFYKFDKWSHIVITYSTIEGKIRIYYNGNIAKDCHHDNIKNQIISPIKEITIGDHSNYVKNAYLDELIIYKEILSHLTIKELYEKCSNKTNEKNTCNLECPSYINEDNQNINEERKIKLKS